MSTAFRAPKGTHDIMPPESRRWEQLIAHFATHAGRAGYGLVQNPMFEDIGVFQRMGAGTDVVRKEMYDFHDKGDRHVALRPEGTASIVRAYVEHRPTPPFKAWYATPVFRYEAPQSGRYRQHHQLGVEALGVGDPDLDVEVITLLWDFFTALGLRDVRLLINTLGEPSDRAGYTERLTAWLTERADALDPEDRAKVADHPLRVLDTKKEQSIEIVRDAPRLLDTLSPEARAGFERVQAGLTAAGIPFTVESRLVRGLDYYTHTTFEIVSDALDAAQSTIGGGGRYDALAEALGGPPTPGVGFGSGVERILLACDAEGVFVPDEAAVPVFVVDTTGGAEARDITRELRRAGIAADRAWDQRSMKAQMKQANRSGATVAVIVGEDEARAATVTVRPLRDDRPQRTVPRSDLTETLHALAAPPDDRSTNDDHRS